MRRALGVCALVALAVAAGSASSSGAGPSAVSITAPTLTVAPWQAATDNLVPVRGSVLVNGSPVSGVRLRVNGYLLPAATDAKGAFVYLADATLAERYAVTVADASHARVAGAAPAAGVLSALRAAHGTIDVAYPIRGLKLSRDGAGHVVVQGRLANGAGQPPPTVALYSYALTGKLTDADGKPVVGARVSTRTVDRDYWTVSTPTAADGSFQSLFTASSEAGGNPVPMTIRVSEGDLVYQYLPSEYAYFQRLQSARVDIRLPPRGYPIALPVPHSYAGAIYQGVVVGAVAGSAVVKPLRVTWPDAAGNFSIVLPSSFAGKTVSLWEGDLRLFSGAPAQAGRPVDLRNWPVELPAGAPQALARVTLK